MIARLLKSIQTYIHDRPRIKKVAGVFLILVGFIALVTPLTPGAWLGLVGFELLGIRIVFSDRFKFWKKK